MADFEIKSCLDKPSSRRLLHFLSMLPSHSAVDGGVVRMTSLPIQSHSFSLSVDGIFTHLLTLTSRITRRLIQFFEEIVLEDVNRFLDHPVTISSGQYPSSLSHRIYKSVSEYYFSSFKSYSHYEIRRDSERGSLCLTEELLVDIGSDIVETINHYLGVSSIFKRLTLPLFALGYAWEIVLIFLRHSFTYVKCTLGEIFSIASRVQRTLRGSSDEIGWLKRTPGMPPVHDGTARFLELLAAIRNGEHSLPDSFVYLLIPGLFSNHGPLYFVGTKRFFSKMGLTCHIAKIHSEASVEHNAWELKECIEEMYWGSGKPVMLLGHSKGGVDAAAALSIYWTHLHHKVAGLALVQSPYAGSPLASDILRPGQIADKETRRIMELLICKFIKGDIRALEDLTYEKRKEFITSHKLPENIPLISFHSEASSTPGVLSTMTHIAHAELPWLPLPSYLTELDLFVNGVYQVPVIFPISAAMALCALHLQLRYGEKSDGLVTCCDAEVPGSVVIRPDQKLYHGWMVYSSRKTNPHDPDASEMCAAILTLLVELGKGMKENGD